MSEKLFNPDYLKHLCAKYGLHPSRRYGQNFLIHPVKSPRGGAADFGGLFGVNPEPVEKMLSAAEIKKTDTVVEIGPGFGVLTFALAEKAKKVIAFEIEKKLAPYWESHAPKNLEIIWGNVLKAAVGGTIGHSPLAIDNYKLVSNLPYQITSAVIRKFLEADNPPELMVLTVQKEVAERICAKPGDMSLLAVSVQYYAEPKIAALVSRSNFWPEPKVDSAILKLTINNEQLANDETEKDRFFNLVKAGFANRRKLLIKNLEAVSGKKRRGELIKVFAQLGLKETARAQELSVEQWMKLAKFLANL